MTRWPVKLASAVAAALVLLPAIPASAIECGHGKVQFGEWLRQFRAYAAANGVSDRTLDRSLAGVSYDRGIIGRDRNQKHFKVSFQQFYAKRVSGGMIGQGRRLWSRHQALFDRVEREFGVSPGIILAVWGLETAYGAVAGSKFPIVRSLATLSYDCRRTVLFTEQLLDALRVIDRGDMTLDQMRGGWAGEIGQTQFLPSGYYKYGVDYDGDGRRDLVRSIPDLIASTANFLKSNGWRAGEPWGPGTHNFTVLNSWNEATVYQKTIALMAERIAQRSGGKPDDRYISSNSGGANDRPAPQRRKRKPPPAQFSFF